MVRSTWYRLSRQLRTAWAPACAPPGAATPSGLGLILLSVAHQKDMATKYKKLVLGM